MLEQSVLLCPKFMILVSALCIVLLDCLVKSICLLGVEIRAFFRYSLRRLQFVYVDQIAGNINIKEPDWDFNAWPIISTG